MSKITKISIKDFWIGMGITLAIALALVSFITFLSQRIDSENLGGRSPARNQYNPETSLFSGTTYGPTSMSVNGAEDQLIIEGDPGTNFASPSVNDVVMFNTASSFDAILLENTHYYVVSTSYTDAGTATSNSDRFQVSRTKGGTVISFGATTSGSGAEDYFTVEIPESGAVDVSKHEFDSFAILANEAPSGSFQFACSIQNAVPDFYASPSIANQYEYTDVYDIEDGASIDGDTGLANLAGADTNRLFQISFINTCKWFFIKSSNLSSGSFYFPVTGY